ncbi:MAG: hypothetical protein AAGD25_40590 [Cyanobacteria bacterium P01_F01_bin.150]
MILCNPPEGQIIQASIYSCLHKKRESREDEFSDYKSGPGISYRFNDTQLVLIHPRTGEPLFSNVGGPGYRNYYVYVGEENDLWLKYFIRIYSGGGIIEGHNHLIELINAMSEMPGSLVGRLRYLDYYYTLDFSQPISCPDDFFDPPDNGERDPTPPSTCTPCPDRLCLAPDNRVELLQIKALAIQLQATLFSLDTEPVKTALEDTIDKANHLKQTVEDGRDELLELISGSRQTITENKKDIEDTLTDISGGLDLGIETFISGDKLTRLFEVLEAIKKFFFDIISASLSYKKTCGQTHQDVAVVEGKGLDIVHVGLSKLADIACEVSKKNNVFKPVATWPEWWATRPGGQVPQCITVYAPKDKDGHWLPGRFPIAVPYANQPSPVKSFWKGNYQGRLILNDNSDLIVHCASEGEARALVMQLSASIPFRYRRGSHNSYGWNAAMSGGAVEVWRKYAEYFPKGQASRESLWKVDYE